MAEKIAAAHFVRKDNPRFCIHIRVRVKIITITSPAFQSARKMEVEAPYLCKTTSKYRRSSAGRYLVGT